MCRRCPGVSDIKKRFSLLLHCPKHQFDFIYHTRWQAKQQPAWHVVMCLQLHFLKIVLKHCKQTEFNSFQQSMSWFLKSTLMLVQNGTCYRLMSHPRAIRAQVKLILIGVSLQCWLGAASPLLISKINSNHFQFHSLILQSRLPRGSRHGWGGVKFCGERSKRCIAVDEEQVCDISAFTSQLFQLDAVIFFSGAGI